MHLRRFVISFQRKTKDFITAVDEKNIILSKGSRADRDPMMI